MIVEIEIEDIGYVRPLNAYQVRRARRVQGPNNAIAWAAFACGLSIRQFKGLPVEKQQQILYAHRFMTSARNTSSPGRQGPVSIGHLLKLVEQWNRAAA